MTRSLGIVAAALIAGSSVPAVAQMNGAMPGMNMPASKSDKSVAKKRKGSGAASSPAANENSQSGMKMPGMKMSKGNAASAMREPSIPQTPPPPPPADHAADRYYDLTQMAEARRALREEQGGAIYSKVFFEVAEFQLPGGYRWDGQAWIGGDINRVVIKSEGEGSRRGGLDSAEIQLLYSRAVAPYTDIQAGVRYDFKPDPSRTYLTLGVQYLIPFYINLEAALFVSNKGELLGRIQGTYDLLLTQRLVLQPRAELDFAAQNSSDIGVGAGLSSAELGLRLRYEFLREFAPYIGVSYVQSVGNTAAYARNSGKETGSTKFVLGIRSWF